MGWSDSTHQSQVTRMEGSVIVPNHARPLFAESLLPRASGLHSGQPRLNRGRSRGLAFETIMRQGGLIEEANRSTLPMCERVRSRARRLLQKLSSLSPHRRHLVCHS